MNTGLHEPRTAPATPATRGADGLSRRLPDAIVEIHAQVGDGLMDQDLTFPLRAIGLPTEAGFAFLSSGNASCSRPAANGAGATAVSRCRESWRIFEGFRRITEGMDARHVEPAR